MADAVLGSLRRSPVATSARPTSTRIARAPAATIDEEIDPDDLDPENGTAEFAGPDTNDAPQPDTPSPGTVNRSPAASAAIVGAEGGEVDADTSARIRRSSGRPLDPAVRGEMESGFGADFSAVRVHTGGEAEQLNRSLSAQAFTTGSDIFLGAGTPSSSSDAGRHLLAHELAHVVQQTAPSTVARRSIVRRKFDPATVTSNAHLRDDGQWGTTKGPKIKKGATVLVNTTAPKTQQKRGSTTTWYPAVNAGPDDWGMGLGAERRGYIRSSRVGPATSDLNVHLGTLVRGILQDTEAWQRTLGTELSTDENVDALVTKALRLHEWNADAATTDLFAPAFSSLLDKVGRIREGAQYTGDMVEHWRQWLHPNDTTIVWSLKITDSDLHEHGLGVIKAEFRKSLGPPGHKFANDTVVKVFLKPEDKSLEQALLGSDATSAANRINQIVGLNNPDEMLTTIRMQATQDHGTLVEAAKGMAAEHIPIAGPQQGVKAVFHETLVFAFLAGIDDLHKENVFWHEGRPYMIDADNVLSRNQMLKVDNGDIDQSGFTPNTDDQAQANRDAIKNSDNSVINSKILNAMLNNGGQRVQIALALRQAITGKKGRVVPIRTSKWAKDLAFYRGNPDHRDSFLDYTAAEGNIARQGKAFDTGVGPGLIGVCGDNVGAHLLRRRQGAGPAEEGLRRRGDPVLRVRLHQRPRDAQRRAHLERVHRGPGDRGDARPLRPDRPVTPQRRPLTDRSQTTSARRMRLRTRELALAVA